MGKAKKPRRRRPNNNPTGMPSAASIAADAAFAAGGRAEATPEQQRAKIRKQFPMISRLEHKDAADREQGCHDIAALVCDDANLASSLARVVTGDLIRISTTAGVHPERIAAVGALRNLSLHGHQVCDDMVRSELVAPCITLLVQAAQLLEGSAAPGEDSEEHRFVCLMAEHLCSTLTNLSEASAHAALQLTAAGTVVPALMTIASAVLSPLPAQRAAAQALVVLVDDSATAQAQVMGSSAAAQAAVAAALNNSSTDVHLKMLLATLLFSTKGPRDALPVLHPVLCSVLSSTDLCASLDQQLQGTKASDNGASASGGFVVNAPSEGVEAWWSQLRAQSLAVELLTNSACVLCEEQEEGDASDEPDADWDSMEGMSEEALHAQLSAQRADDTPSAISELAGFLELVLPKLAPVPPACLALCPTRPEVASMVAALWTFLGKAAALVGNLSSGLSSTAAPFFLCWGRLRALLTPATPLHTTAQAVAAFGAVLRQATAVGAAPELAAARALEDPVIAAAEAVAACQEAEQADRVAALSLLGAAGLAVPDSAVAERAAGALLAVLGAAQPEVALGAEALNALFDLFGDDHANKALYGAAGVHAKLTALLPNWKALIRALAGSEEREVIETAHEAALNLKRFLQYKAAH